MSNVKDPLVLPTKTTTSTFPTTNAFFSQRCLVLGKPNTSPLSPGGRSTRVPPAPKNTPVTCQVWGGKMIKLDNMNLTMRCTLP